MPLPLMSSCGTSRVSRLMVLLAVTLLAGTLAPPPADASVTDGLILHYRLDQADGTTVTDSSGHGRDGVLAGDTSWQAADGLWLGGDSGHVRLPDNLLRGLGQISVSVQARIDAAQAAPYFVWGMGNSTSWYGDGYLFVTGDTYRGSIASGNWSTEQSVSAGHNVARGAWRTLTYTLAGGTAVLYEDGVEVARKTGITLTPADIGAGTTTANYLGRSLYSGDKYLTGNVRDFRVYDRALTEVEIAELGAQSAAERVASDAAALSLGDTSAVTESLTLPTTGATGARITWASSVESVVSATGVVTRPRPRTGNATVTLTATLGWGGATATKAFTVTVLEDLTDAEKAKAATRALTIPDANALRGNITLPTTGLYGTTITWRSSKPKQVTPTGEVTRPRYGRPSYRVVLTATVRLKRATIKRTFAVTVLPLPKKVPYEGYMFAYFTGESTQLTEQVYFAASRGNDPLHWDELNGSAPVLTSQYGEGGVRDPFIIRSPEGDKFYLIATDLQINGGSGWGAAMRFGSKYLEIWESTDLVHWSAQRHVRVSADTAGMTWAPEATYDPAIGAYVVYWASNLYAAADVGHTGSTYPRMLYATTRDFRTFSEPRVWNDPGTGVIDSTVLADGGNYYRFTTDDRTIGSCGRDIVMERSTRLRAVDLPDTKPRNWELVDDCIRTGIGTDWVEGPTAFKSNTEQKWYVFVDETPNRGYVPFQTDSLTNPNWSMPADYALPARPRHGTVLPVTKAELKRLRANFPA